MQKGSFAEMHGSTILAERSRFKGFGALEAGVVTLPSGTTFSARTPVTGNYASWYGGVAVISGGTFSAKYCRFDSNRAGETHDAPAPEGGVALIQSGTFSAEYSSFI